jgi:dTDP-4-dehydrorhamnose 3,5-epimerase
MWNDTEVGIEWPALLGDAVLDPLKLVLSDKDKLHPPLSNLKKH